jgi:CHAD domain-containing protein
MEQSFNSYIHQQVKVFRKNFIRSTSRKNFDEIHDYRVSLKRIRTIVNFIRKVPGAKNLKNCYNINNLQLAFKSGGVLREMQINRRLLAAYENKLGEKFYGFRNYIKYREKNSFKDLKRARDRFSGKKLKKFETKLTDTIEKIPATLILEKIDKFILKRIGQIKKLVKDRNVESTLHRIRRQTKSIKYLLEMGEIGSRSYGDLEFELEKITELEDLIGTWHDQQVFKIDLDKYISGLQRRKLTDSPAEDLKKAVGKKYKKIFKQTVQAVYDHYKISSEKNSVSAAEKT